MTSRAQAGRPAVAGPGPRPGARVVALLVAAASAVGVWLTWRAFVTSGVGRTVDEAALDGADFGQTTLWAAARPVLDVVSVSFILLGVGAAAVVALLRRRWVLALQAVVLVAGANLTTQLLKYELLERPDLGAGSLANSLPSGHTTVAASFAAALLVVSPRRARPWLAVLGGGYAAATGVSTLIGQWHRPSDAIAALLVVLAWAALVCGVGPASSCDPPEPSATTGTGVAAVLLALVVLASGAPAVWGLAEAYDAVTAGAAPGAVQTYVAGALGVVATAAAAFLVLLLVRQSTARRASG